MNERVLITGATGLIGRMTVAPLAAKGFEIVALSRRGPVSGATVTIECDVLDPVARSAAIQSAGASHLLHLAWHDAPDDRWSARQNIDWVAATLLLVREFVEKGGKRAVCVGSCAEYDWTEETLREDTPLRPSSLYGNAKASTGTLLTSAAPDLGLSLAWARVFFCYGPGEPPGRLLGDLLLGLSRAEPVPCTDGLQERDFLHTHDIGRALAAILDSDLTGPVNVASGQAIPVRQLILTAAELMGRRDLIQLGAKKRPPNDPDRLVADVTKLASLGFQPEFDLTTGLEDCIRAAQK